jgi:hypothetical protein
MTLGRRRSSRALRASSVSAVAVVAVLALSSCTAASDDPDPAASTATGAPTSFSGTALDVPCDDLVDPAALDAAVPGLVPADDAEEAEADDALLQPVVATDGTLCRWTDADGAAWTVGVAELDADSLTAVGNDRVASSTPVPTYGVEGYFRQVGGTGVAEALSSPWLVVVESDSTTAVEPGAVEPVVTSVLVALDARG